MRNAIRIAESRQYSVEPDEKEGEALESAQEVEKSKPGTTNNSVHSGLLRVVKAKKVTE